MRIPYLSLILIIAIYKLAIIANLFCFKSQDFPQQPIEAWKPISVTEQLFAFGERAAISQIDLYDLELIPGVSDTLGTNIIKARHKIIAAADSKNFDAKINPFELAHGVGKKTALKLERYLLPE